MSLTTEELQRLLDAATPGPWSVDDNGYTYYIETIPGFNHAEAYSEADARLIAAAHALARQRIAADRMADAAEWFAKNFAGPRGAELVEAIAAFREDCK
ncbi:MAG: hypothetical protein Tp176DCM1853251_40 [Prokaryotic dsDNA virus sp.]|nr:MAG: hypothetical protein Tp176DCM1853251_40 [Prokaryotic dsDNA virus sp.]|tara:strand:- start:4406 stop:4702 length:297 start_codon:yes stop_codon:yes gene_type:complete